jgi:hypothetical protein
MEARRKLLQKNRGDCKAVVKKEELPQRLNNLVLTECMSRD